MGILHLKTALKSKLLTLSSKLPNLKQIKYLSLSQQYLLFVLAVFLIFLFYYKFYSSSSSLQEEVRKEFVIEVMGEVQKPGIYVFSHSPSLKDVIEKAGGLKEPITFDSDRLKETLETGTLIAVQKRSFSPLPENGSEKGGQITVRIKRMEANKLLLFQIPLNLNQVSAEDLCLLPGIGESLAREILTYRQRQKGFRSVEELRNVNGISDKKLEILKPFLTVSPQ